MDRDQDEVDSIGCALVFFHAFPSSPRAARGTRSRDKDINADGCEEERVRRVSFPR